MIFLRKVYPARIADANPTSTWPSPLDRLPNELFLHILSLVAYMPGELDDDVSDPMQALSGPPTFSLGRKELIERSMLHRRLLLRVCKAWNRDARRFCFAALYITALQDIASAADYFERSMSSDAEYGQGAGRWVRRVQLSLRVWDPETASGQLARLVAHTPNLAIFAFRVEARVPMTGPLSGQVTKDLPVLPPAVLEALSAHCASSLRVIEGYSHVNAWKLRARDAVRLVSSCPGLRILHCDIDDRLEVLAFEAPSARLVSVQCPRLGLQGSLPPSFSDWDTTHLVRPEHVRIYSVAESKGLTPGSKDLPSRAWKIEAFLRTFGASLRTVDYYMTDDAPIAPTFASACPNIEWITLRMRGYAHLRTILRADPPLLPLSRLRGIVIYTSSFLVTSPLLHALERIVELVKSDRVPFLRIVRFGDPRAIPALLETLEDIYERLGVESNVVDPFPLWAEIWAAFQEREIRVEDWDGCECIWDSRVRRRMFTVNGFYPTAY